MRNHLKLVLLLAVESAALAGAWTEVRLPDPIDWSRPAAWLARTTPESALLAAGRLVLIAVTAWLLFSTLLAIVAQLALAVAGTSRTLGTFPRAVRRCTPAFVRHAVEGAVAISLVAGTTTVRPASAGTGEPVRVPVATVTDRVPVPPLGPVRHGRVDPVVSSTATVPATGGVAASTIRPTAASTPLPSPHLATPAPTPAPAARDLRLVAPGESLWTIARDHLGALGRPADDASVGRYWRTLCDANRDALVSGDVNVVHPGESLELPPVA